MCQSSDWDLDKMGENTIPVTIEKTKEFYQKLEEEVKSNPQNKVLKKILK